MAALVWTPLELRTGPTAEMALELVDRRALRPPNGAERHGLMGTATEALDLEVAEVGVQGVPERR
jgi:hypothetical protein